MKKFLLAVMCTGIVLLTGCGADKEKVMKCTRTINQTNINMDLVYNVTYKGKYVSKISSTEKIISDNATVLETYQEQLESITATFKDIKYYDHNIKIDGNTLTSTIDIDYEKIDTNKLIEIDSSMKQFIKDGKVAVEDIESLYSQMGITCEK